MSANPPGPDPAGWQAPLPPNVPGYGYHSYGGPGYVGPVDHPQASTALGLGVGSLAGLLICWLPAFLGPVAWYLGAKAIKEIDAEPYRYSGRGSAMAGMVTGIISTVILLCAIVALVVFIVILVNDD